MLWKYCTQYASKFRKLSSGQRTGKGQFSFQSKRMAVLKNVQNIVLALILHASELGFSNMWTMNFLMLKLVLEKAEEPEIKLPTSAGSSIKQENSRKTSISALLLWSDCLNHNKLENPYRVGYQATWPASWEICMQVRKQWLEMDMEQWTGSKEEKEYVKAVYSHPAYLTSMQSTSWETLGWKDKWESRWPGEISITSDMQRTPSLWQKVKRN